MKTHSSCGLPCERCEPVAELLCSEGAPTHGSLTGEPHRHTRSLLPFVRSGPRCSVSFLAPVYSMACNARRAWLCWNPVLTLPCAPWHLLQEAALAILKAGQGLMPTQSEGWQAVTQEEPVFQSQSEGGEKLLSWFIGGQAGGSLPYLGKTQSFCFIQALSWRGRATHLKQDNLLHSMHWFQCQFHAKTAPQKHPGWCLTKHPGNPVRLTEETNQHTNL